MTGKRFTRNALRAPVAIKVLRNNNSILTAKINYAKNAISESNEVLMIPIFIHYEALMRPYDYLYKKMTSTVSNSYNNMTQKSFSSAQENH